MDPVPTRNPAGEAGDDAEHKEARRYVKRLRDFYQLLIVAVLVVALTAIVNLSQGGRIWFHWVVVGFGIALAFTALDTFGRSLWLGRAWQERKEREYLARRRG
jgi:hypothetical protein